MAYVRKTKNAAEFSARMSECAKMRKNIHNCGRKPMPPERAAAGVKCVTIRGDDYKVFQKLAFKNGDSLVNTFHLLANALLAKHPELSGEIVLQ